MAFSGTVFSIAFFNFAGISVTKEMSATTRMVLDSVRTLVIWGVSLAIGWQPFQALQLLGFAVLVTGMCVYNDIVIGKIILFIFVLFSTCIKVLGKYLIIYKSKSLRSTLTRGRRLFFSALIPS